MSLRLWLPLTNTVENLGLENCEFTTNNITSVDGKINQYAAHFNGNNSWISIKNPPDLNITDFSFAFWLKIYADINGSSPHTEYDNDDIEYDYSGYGNHAIANSDIKSNSDSYLYNSCREFNGDKQWFTIQNPLRKIFNDDFTISVWVNISVAHRAIILGNYNKTPVITFDLKAGRVRLYWDGNPDLSGSIAISLNTWHNIIFIRNNNTLKIYVDGVLDNSVTPDSLSVLDITALSRVGDDYRGDTDNTVSFPGKMSDLRIYGTALSEDDIKELYNVPTSLDNNGNIFTGELIEED